MLREQNSALAEKQARVADLYETHFERVVRYVGLRIGFCSDCEELAAEVFVRALATVEGFKDTGAPMEAWVFRIAHNLVVDHLRKRSRRPASVPLDDAPPVVGNSDPAEEAERRMEVERLGKAMAGLSESQRQVLSLRFGGDMSSEQAARIMGKSPGAVREMQSAAIRKLRQIMKE